MQENFADLLTNFLAFGQTIFYNEKKLRFQKIVSKKKRGEERSAG